MPGLMIDHLIACQKWIFVLKFTKKITVLGPENQSRLQSVTAGPSPHTCNRGAFKLSSLSVLMEPGSLGFILRLDFFVTDTAEKAWEQSIETTLFYYYYNPSRHSSMGGEIDFLFSIVHGVTFHLASHYHPSIVLM